jgi:hypothetical protein
MTLLRGLGLKRRDVLNARRIVFVNGPHVATLRTAVVVHGRMFTGRLQQSGGGHAARWALWGWHNRGVPRAGTFYGYLDRLMHPLVTRRQPVFLTAKTSMAVTPWHCHVLPRYCQQNRPVNIEGVTCCQPTGHLLPFFRWL